MWMADGHGRDAWGHTSCLLSLTANINRDPKKGKESSPSDWNPYAAQDKENAPKEVTELRDLKHMFVRSSKVTLTKKVEKNDES